MFVSLFVLQFFKDRHYLEKDWGRYFSDDSTISPNRKAVLEVIYYLFIIVESVFFFGSQWTIQIVILCLYLIKVVCPSGNNLTAGNLKINSDLVFLLFLFLKLRS